MQHLAQAVTNSLVALEVPQHPPDIQVKINHMDSQSIRGEVSNVKTTSQAKQLSTAALGALLEEIYFSPRGAQYTLSPYI